MSDDAYTRAMIRDLHHLDEVYHRSQRERVDHFAGLDEPISDADRAEIARISAGEPVMDPATKAEIERLANLD